MTLDQAKLRDVWKASTSDDTLRCMRYSVDSTCLLQELKSARLDSLNSGIEALRLSSTFNFLPKSCIGSVLYIRDFYHKLFDVVLEESSSCILTGNPGISKSWFQMYILVQNPKFTVVVRQYEKRVTLFDLEDLQAFTCRDLRSLEILDEIESGKGLYLMEPGSTAGIQLEESDVKTIATVSPDSRRYKEFKKNTRARKLYMPLWTLDELLTVRADICANCVTI